MNFLTSRRRHPLARPLMLVLALFLVGVGYMAVAPAGKSSAETEIARQVSHGEELFTVNCASCHGLNAEGTSQGPSLVGVGSASVDFQVSTGRMPMAKPAQQAPRKPTKFSDEEIAALAAYVASLGPGVAVPEPEQYDTAGLTEEEIAEGGEIFRTNCSACHNYAGLGGALPDGRYAPPLTDVEPRHIYEALRVGPQQMPVFSQENLSDKEVRMIIAYLKDIDAQPNRGGMDLGGNGPVGEGLWAWILGVGGLMVIAGWIASKGARAK